MTKMETSEVRVGALHEVTLRLNPMEGSAFRFRGTHLDAKRAPKVILSKDTRFVAGVAAMARIVSIEKPAREDHGYIEVAFERSIPLRMEGMWVDPMVSKKLEVLLENGLNVLLDGPQGSGKTTLARRIAGALSMELVFFNCGAVVEASDFFASLQLRAGEGGAPITDFVKTDVLLAIEEAHRAPEKRFLIFLDELNRCPESARNALMPALDATRRVFHPVENRFITIPDNVQFIAAVNRGREFSATFGIDAAQLDRFAPLQVTYPPPPEEEKILRARHPSLGQETIALLVKIADVIRNAPEMNGTLSLRATDEACIYLAHDHFKDTPRLSMPEILKSSFCARFSGKWSDATSDAGLVWMTIVRVMREAGVTIEG